MAKILFLVISFTTITFINGYSSNVYIPEETETERVFTVPLDTSGEVIMHWSLDYASSEVFFEIHFPASKAQWFAFGFSDYGHFSPADYCVLWTDWKGSLHFDDTFTNNDGVLLEDNKQNCLNFQAKVRHGKMKFAFTREFDTCDDDDYTIEEGTTHIVWAKGDGPLYRLSGLDIDNVRDEDRGMIRVQLLKNLEVQEEVPKEAWTFDVLADNVHVPPVETTYWCHVHRLPDKLKRKQHLIQFENHIQEGNEGLVHHIEVFHCVAPVNERIPDYVGPCFDVKRPNSTQVCKKVIAAWAMGALPFSYPEEAGYPIGGPDFNPFVMLEVHYNNPQLRPDWVDSSGIRLTILPHLRKYDAGIMELGLEYTDKMAIPPEQKEFSLSGYCVTECTAVALSTDGIIIFGSQLHTHLTGIRVFTRHIRDGRELNELNRDNHFSTHFQEIRRLKRPVKVLPGDALITTCIHNTKERTNITLGGFSISDEMCVNYVYYYPDSMLEVCKSSVSDEALSTYFKFLNEWERQDTSPNKGISDNYKSIEWTPLRAQVLWEMYHEAPLGMQCNMSTGDRFPGYWDNTPVTTVTYPLPPPSRDCIDLNNSEEGINEKK